MLSGIGEQGEKTKFHLGHFFIAIDTEAFMGLDNFKKTTGDTMRELRATTKATGAERIYTDDEKEYLIWQDPNPIVFAIANPVLEIMPDLAIKAVVAVIGTGRMTFLTKSTMSLPSLESLKEQ